MTPSIYKIVLNVSVDTLFSMNVEKKFRPHSWVVNKLSNINNAQKNYRRTSLLTTIKIVHLIFSSAQKNMIFL